MLKSSKKLFAILLIATFVAGMVVVPNTAFAARREPMRDLDIDVNKLVSDIEDERAKEAVLRLNAFGVIDGMEDGKYHPDEKLTREQFAKILVTALKMDTAAKAGIGYKSFPDVDAGRWSAGFIGVAAGESLIQGYPDGTFKPAKEVSYAEAITMLVRALGYKDEFLLGAWPGNYLAKAAQKDITKYVKFSDAAGIVNRGDAAILVNNTLDAKVVRVDTYKGGGTEYFESEKKLLEDRLNILKAEDTRILANKRVDDGLKEEEVRVRFTKDIVDPASKDQSRDYNKFDKGDEEELEIVKGFNPEPYLGEEVTVYLNDDDEVIYAEVENDDKAYFDYVEGLEKDKELSLVKADDDYDFDKDAIVYIMDGDKYKAVDGEDVTLAQKKDMIGKVGKFVIKNRKIIYAEVMDMGEAYPWMVVFENKDGLLKGICEDDDEFELDLTKDGNYDGVIVLDTDGEELSVDDIEEGNLIYAQKQEYDGDDYAVVRVVKDNIIEGKLDRVQDNKVKIGDVERKVVHYGKTFLAYYSIDDGDEIKCFDSNELVDDMDDADEEEVIAYTDAVGRVAYFVTAAEAASGYKYGVVKRVYADKDRIKVFTIAEDGEDDDFTFNVEEEKNVKNPLLLNEYGQKTSTKSDEELKEGAVIKFKLNKDGEIAEDKLYVMNPAHLWKMKSSEDFGKDYLPKANLIDANKALSEDFGGLKYNFAVKGNSRSFSVNDNVTIIDAEKYVFTKTKNKEAVSFGDYYADISEGDFAKGNWKDLSKANGIDSYFYVFCDDDKNVNAKAVVFIGNASGSAANDEIGIYAIKKSYKAGDTYIDYLAYGEDKIESRIVDNADKSPIFDKKEMPYIAKVKSNGKLDIVTPGKSDDGFDMYFGKVKERKADSLTLQGTYKVDGPTLDKYSTVGKTVDEIKQVKMFNISSKTLVYEEDSKKSTSNLSKGDIVLMVVENETNARVIERVIDGEYGLEKIIGEETPGTPGAGEEGTVTYIDATNKAVYVDNTPYVLGASTVLKTAKGSIIAVGDSAILTALATDDVLADIVVKDGVVTSLVATKIASVQTAAVTAVINTLNSNELNPAHADFNKNGNDVTNARAAYNALTPAQRDFVTNYAKLVAAEAALASADAANVAADKAALTVTYDGTAATITLPASGTKGSTISWVSDKTAIIASGATGAVTVNRPSFTDGDATVKLTATIKSGDVEDTKDFTVTVKAKDATDAEKVALDKAALTIPGDLNNVTANLTLAATGENGSAITWASGNTAIITDAGVVTRPAGANVQVTMTATITSGTESVTKVFYVTVLGE